MKCTTPNDPFHETHAWWEIELPPKAREMVALHEELEILKGNYSDAKDPFAALGAKIQTGDPVPVFDLEPMEVAEVDKSHDCSLHSILYLYILNTETGVR